MPLTGEWRELEIVVSRKINEALANKCHVSSPMQDLWGGVRAERGF